MPANKESKKNTAATNIQRKAVKKKPAAKTKPVKRKTTNKTVSKKISKTTPKKTTKKAAAPKSDVNKKRKVAAVSEIVTLPKVVSEEAIEKTLTIRREFDRLFRHRMYQVAYMTGACFIVVGLVLLANVALPTNQLALTYYSTTTTESGVLEESTTAVREEVVPPPYFDFTSLFPESVNDDFTFTFQAKYAKDISAFLFNLNLSEPMPVRVDKVDAVSYKGVVKVSDLKPGYYVLNVALRAENDGASSMYRSSRFKVITQEHIEIVTEKDVSEAEVPTSADQAPSSTEKSVADDLYEDKGAAGEDVESDDIATTTKNETAAEDKDVPIEATSTEDTVFDKEATTTKEVSEKEESIIFKLYSEEKVIAGKTKLALSVPRDVRIVSIMARPVRSAVSQYVTTAKNYDGHWYAVFDSTNLRNGEYEFYAKTYISDTPHKTEGIQLQILNPLPEPLSSEVENDNEVKTEESESGVAVKEDVSQIPEYVIIDDLEEDSTEISNQEERDAVEESTQEVLTQNKEELNALLRNLQTAKIGGDPVLIKSALEALAAFKQRTTHNIFDESEDFVLTDDIDAKLNDHIDRLVKKTETFATLRSEKRSRKAVVDTDSDGIADFDEINLYGTNPLVNDTDNDGVTDGIEIMRGFDPVDATPEVVIAFQSPKESIGLEYEDILMIDEVSPVVEDHPTSDEAPVKAMITGKGLPNSFVTLYIFSTPTVVTIKTNADGYFEYVFDRELEDGQHDVYVAVTDNVGEIVAQSKPFTFVKEAQAFNAINPEQAVEEPAVVLTTNDQGENSGMYGTIVGIGILALGVILLMLGIGLRTRNEEYEDSLSMSDDQSDSSDEGKIVITERVVNPSVTTG